MTTITLLSFFIIFLPIVLVNLLEASLDEQEKQYIGIEYHESHK